MTDANLGITLKIRPAKGIMNRKAVQ